MIDLGSIAGLHEQDHQLHAYWIARDAVGETRTHGAGQVRGVDRGGAPQARGVRRREARQGRGRGAARVALSVKAAADSSAGTPG
jgi:hypothetical protein